MLLTFQHFLLHYWQKNNTPGVRETDGLAHLNKGILKWVSTKKEKAQIRGVYLYIRGCVYVYTHICTYTHTHSVRRLAGLPLFPQLHNVLFSHFHNLGHFPTPKDVLLHRMKAVCLANGAAKGCCHLFGQLNGQVLYQVLHTHYLVYSGNNPTRRLTVAS